MTGVSLGAPKGASPHIIDHLAGSGSPTLVMSSGTAQEGSRSHGPPCESGGPGHAFTCTTTERDVFPRRSFAGAPAL